jgi:cytoskeletal protein CcmA (bactofilin family)
MAVRPSGWRRLVLRTPEPDASARPAPAGAPEAEAARIDFGAELNGRLVVERSLLVEGEFRGELESAGSVCIAESGAVVAPIRARSVEIRGAVMGDVIAAREVVIHAGGRLHGDVDAPSLVIERGATFNGRVRMVRPERSRAADVPAATHPASGGARVPGSGT